MAVPLCLGLVFLLAKVFVVINISCSSQFGPCNTDLDKTILGYKEKNIFKAKQELSKLLRENPLVYKYSLNLKSPTNLEIQLVERVGRVAIAGKTGTSFWIVDSDGLVIKTDNTTALPVLYTKDYKTQVGYKVSEEYLFVCKLIALLSDTYGVGSGRVSGDGLHVTLNDKTEVIFPLVGDEDLLLGSLRYLLSRLKQISTGTTIDLRYKNPIIRR